MPTERLKWAFWLIAGFMVVEVIGGLVSGSLTLLADAAHMATDAAALGLAYWAAKLAERQRRERLAHGLSRLPILSAFSNALLLLPLVAWMVWEAVSRILEPQPVIAGSMLAVAAVGLIVNIVVFRALHRHGAADVNVRGAVLHVVGDMLGSAAAIVGALVILVTGWTLVDPILSLAVAALVLWGAAGLLRETGQFLLGVPPDLVTEQAVREALVSAIDGLADVRHVHAWRTSEGEQLVALHLMLERDGAERAVLRACRALLPDRFGVRHAVLEVEPRVFVCETLRA